MEFISPFIVTTPDGTRLCYHNEAAEPGDWVLSKSGCQWEKLTTASPSFCRAKNGRFYATERKVKEYQRRCGRPVVLPKEVQDEIRQIWQARPTYKKLAERFGCSPDLICSIVTNRNEKRRLKKVCTGNRSKSSPTKSTEATSTCS